MRVIFVRHGRSEGNLFGLIQGHLDFHLSDEGRQQASQAARGIKRFLKNKPLMFSSDLSRAWETAAIIAEELNLPLPIPDRRLRERFMGKAQYRHWTTIDWEAINNGKSVIIDLETTESFLKRINEFLLDLMQHATLMTDTAIVVTHGGTLVHIYHLLLGLEIEEVPKVLNATIHVFELIKNEDKIKARQENLA